MSKDFRNVYADRRRAEAYAGLDFPGTYWLAFRDLPAIIARHARGSRALDFGCGAGRSTRFLRELGFRVVGVDIASEMIRRARELDPDGDYRLVEDGDPGELGPRRFDLILSAFTFDNVPTRERKVALFRMLGGLLAARGSLVNLVSSPEIYTHEWASFSTKDFPENRRATTGDLVRIVMLDVDDRRPVEDVLWTEDAYREVYGEAGLRSVEVHRPLGRESDPFEWVTENAVSPWAIHVIRKRGREGTREAAFG